MDYFKACLFSFLLALVTSSELTFELPDNEKLCFHEVINNGVKCTLEYQVITGGNYDIDVELTSPKHRTLYKETKKQYDSYTWTTDNQGEYKFCFSNEFSTFTHKLIYFDLKVGDEEQPIKSALGDRVTSVTQMEMSSLTIRESMKHVIDYQTHNRMREAQGRSFAEDVHDGVQYWSLGQSVVILAVSIGQILILRSFFTEKRGGHPAPSFGRT